MQREYSVTPLLPYTMKSRGIIVALAGATFLSVDVLATRTTQHEEPSLLHLTQRRQTTGSGSETSIRSRRKLEDGYIMVDSVFMVDVVTDPTAEGITSKDFELLQETLQEAFFCSTSAEQIDGSMATVDRYSIDAVEISTGGMICSYQKKFRRFINPDGVDCLYETKGATVTWVVQVQGSMMVDAYESSLSNQILLGKEPSDGSSVCPRLPTADELASRWTNLLSEAGVTTIQRLENIVATEQKECDPDGATTFTTYLILDVEGDQTQITGQEKRGLERLCVDLYNTLNALNQDTCDPSHRVALGAELSFTSVDGILPKGPHDSESRRLSESDRRLQDSLEPSASPAPSTNTTDPPSSTPTSLPSSMPTIRGPTLFSLVLSMSGTCNGCPSDQQLFDNDITVFRRALSERLSQRTSDLAIRSLQPLDEDFAANCLCPVGATEESGPESADFFELWVNVSSGFAFIDRLAEVREETCIRNETFSSYVTVDVEIEDGASPKEVVDGLAESIQEGYNLNAADGCDPLGRTLVGTLAISDEDPERRLDDANSFSLPPTSDSANNSTYPTTSPSSAPTIRGPNLFSLSYFITGVCSGCASDFKLFDDLTFVRTRRLNQYEDASMNNMYQNSTDTSCTCPFDRSLEPKGPSPDNFLERLNEVIEKKPGLSGLRAKNFTATETPPTTSPTATPSTTPSDKPSSSTLPSSAPSPIPSDSPSTAPSVSPSDVPSMTPTICLHPTSCQEGNRVCASAVNLCAGEGSCNGKNACRSSSGLQVGDSGCVGTSACQSATDLDVGDNSCLETCESLSGSVGSGSCITPSSCFGTGATVQIGDNSCLESDSCTGLQNARRSSLLTIGDSRYVAFIEPLPS